MNTSGFTSRGPHRSIAFVATWLLFIWAGVVYLPVPAPAVAVDSLPDSTDLFHVLALFWIAFSAMRPSAQVALASRRAAILLVFNSVLCAVSGHHEALGGWWYYRFFGVLTIALISHRVLVAGRASDWVSYAYDAVSNRLTEGRPAGTTTYTYNAADQLTAQSGLNGAKSFSYDARGNQAAAGSDTFAYNLADRMTSATASGTTTTYAYDGDGVRLDATSGAATTRFLWDVNNPLPLLALETDGSGGVERRYAYGHELLSMEDASGSHYFHGDHLGSVIEVTNASGATQWEYAYEPYGLAKTTTQVDPNAPTNPMRFTGQHLDPTGLYHLRARQYDPVTGIFGGLDPINPASGQPSTSSYGYVMGHPTVGVDPSGLICFSCPLKKAAKVVDDAWDATGGKAVSWAADNPGSAATMVGVGVCVIGTLGACGAAAGGAFAVRATERIIDNGFRGSLRANLADATITYATFGLVAGPASLGLRRGGSAAIPGLLSAGERGLMVGAPLWQQALPRFLASTPDLAGCSGGRQFDSARLARNPK